MPVSKKQFYAIKAALTATEKQIINYYELQWHLRHHVPTIDEVLNYINGKYEKEGKQFRVKYTAINYYLQRAPVKKALKDRGIPFEQHTQEDLTPTQQAAAITVMNFADERSIAEKLDQLGINPSQYYAWLNDPTFKNFVTNLADQNKINIRPAAVAEFTKKVHSGDWNALKFWLESTGELQGNDAPQSEVLIRMLIEIIQKHVKDPVIITAIARDIQQASLNRSLEVVEPHPALEGTVVNSEEIDLETAKKMLGIN